MFLGRLVHNFFLRFFDVRFWWDTGFQEPVGELETRVRVKDARFINSVSANNIRLLDTVEKNT